MIVDFETEARVNTVYNDPAYSTDEFNVRGDGAEPAFSAHPMIST